MLWLAKISSPVIPRPSLDPISTLPAVDFPTPISRDDAVTSLGRLFTRLLQLPTETRQRITGHLQGHLVESLLRAIQTTKAFLDRGGADGSSTPHDLTSSDGIGSLYARATRIFGRRYLSEVGFNQTENVSSIQVESKPKRGIRFALGTYGLCAVRILYGDGSLSPWLGDHGGCWYGEVYGEELGKLRITRDVSAVEATIP